MKRLIRQFIPKALLQFYHKTLALLAAFVYHYPSNKMIVIGVTGTNGKSSTVKLIAKALESGGDKVGATSTIEFKIADREWLNNKKMTMLGRFQLQKLLKQMVRAGCRYAVIETSSQGIEQYRHLGLNYDYAVFTNLTPEHLEAHGGFENYKKAKGRLFEFLTAQPHKKFDNREVQKTSVINIDDKHAYYYQNFNADKKVTFSSQNLTADFIAQDINVQNNQTQFKVKNTQFNLKLIGAFNVYNCLPAIAIADQEGIAMEKIKTALESITGIPGRMEFIDEAQPFNVIVDYAPEPASLEKLYETIDLMQKNKVIHVLGSCGGGRDKERQPILGQMAGVKADFVIVTNEDPYDDDPMEIINNIATGAITKGKVENQNLFKILDRRQAIEKAISLAQKNDLVLITGKGCEQAMCVADGKKIPWDDRGVVRQTLKEMSNR